MKSFIPAIQGVVSPALAEGLADMYQPWITGWRYLAVSSASRSVRENWLVLNTLWPCA
ncbi:Uncharacterised protein [Mycobacterium tuberculosis]|nr:Uncharacterised protein [Mycobacterium tuberculosis]